MRASTAKYSSAIAGPRPRPRGRGFGSSRFSLPGKLLRGGPRSSHLFKPPQAEPESKNNNNNNNKNKVKDDPGFWYDKANLRWVRDDKRGLPLSEWQEGGMTTIKTKTGEEYTVWPAIHITLSNSDEFSVVEPQDVIEMVKEGNAVVVDVRPEGTFEKTGRIEGSVNVPLYRAVQGGSVFKTIKKIAVAAMAMEATERNPDFLEDARRALGGGDPSEEGRTLVVCCTIGGSMETEVVSKRGKVFSDPEKAFGRESRSLKACYELIQGGYTKVAHLRGGIAMWRHKELPME